MKLCYVYDAVYPWETGGVQKRVWEIARRLADDHDVHWYGLHYWDGPAVHEREGVTLHAVGQPRELYVDGRRSITEALYFASRLVRPLANAEYDVVDCQAFPFFSCYASKLGVLGDDTTYLVTWHEVWEEFWHEYLGWKGIFGRAVERGTVFLPDEHVTVSHKTSRDLEALGGVSSHRLPNGIDIEYIDGVDPTEESIDVLFVGRFIWEKNPELLVRAIDRLREERPNVRCHMVGDGPEREAVERLVAERDLEDTVDILDFRESHEDIVALMKAADVFTLPSRREGFGITVLEALAAGTPVVTIDHPGNAAVELVADGETGYVVDDGPEAVADALRDAPGAIDPDTCRAAAADYDWDRIADRAEALYQEVRS
mgnify:CR=1 FL=1